VTALALLLRLAHVGTTAKVMVVDDAEFFEQHARRFLAAWAAAGTDAFFPALRDAVDHASLQGVLYPLSQSVVYLLSRGVDHTVLVQIQAVLGAAACGLTCLAARRAFGAAAGLAAGTITALYPPLVLTSGLLLAETQLVFLQALGSYLLVRGLAPEQRLARFLGGSCIGLLMLRPALQYSGPLALLALFLAGLLAARAEPRAQGQRGGERPHEVPDPVRFPAHRHTRGLRQLHGLQARLRRGFGLAVPAAAGLLVIALPWVAMNGLVYGRFVWSRTGDAWQQVYWGIYPPNRGWWPPDSPVPPKYGVESLPGAWSAGMRIEVRDLDYLEAAIDQVRATPLQAVATEVNKLYQAYLHPFNAYGEAPPLVGHAGFAITLHRGFAFLALAGLALGWLRPAGSLVLGAGLLAAALPFLASHVDLRYTIPPAQAAAPFAGLAVAQVWRALQGVRRRRTPAPAAAPAARDRGERPRGRPARHLSPALLLALPLVVWGTGIPWVIAFLLASPLIVWSAGIPWIVALLPGLEPFAVHVVHSVAMCLAFVSAGMTAGYVLLRAHRQRSDEPTTGGAGSTGGAPAALPWRFVASGTAAGLTLSLLYGIQAAYDGDWHQWSTRLPVGGGARQAILLPDDWSPPADGRAELRLYMAGSREPTYEPVVRVNGREVRRLGPAFADAGPLRFEAKIMVAARNQGKARVQVPQWFAVPVDLALLADHRVEVEVAIEPFVAGDGEGNGDQGEAAPEAGRTDGWGQVWGDYPPRPGIRAYDGPAVHSRIAGADQAFLKFVATGEYGIWRWTPLRSPRTEAARRHAGAWQPDLSDAAGRQTGEYRIRLLVFSATGDLVDVF
jgi:hypothetical protein